MHSVTFRLLVALLCASLGAAAHARLVVMHGYADYTSALVWVQADAPGPIRVAWRSEHDGREQQATFDARAD